MTAQAGERLFYKGEETWMAAEPLNQYLQNRNDIKFVSPSTACWRGYYGQWEIKDRKLYLIELKAYLEGYKNRIEKREKEKIEQIEKDAKKDKITTAVVAVSLSLALIGICLGLYYLLQQNTTLTYLFSVIIVIPLLLIIGGLLFLIANKEKDRAKEDKGVVFVAINFLVLVFIGICIGLFYLIKWGTLLAYFISALVIITLLYLIFLETKNQLKKKKI